MRVRAKAILFVYSQCLDLAFLRIEAIVCPTLYLTLPQEPHCRARHVIYLFTLVFIKCGFGLIKMRYFGSLVGKWLPEVFTSRTANTEKHEVAG
jgi:hypothetical protein